MKKIVLLPLDERPCNYNFPYELCSNEEVNIVRPKELGDKKTSADVTKLIKFLKEECKRADALVLSLDTLLYGGLIPSRLHTLTQKEAQERMAVIRELKKENPHLKVYAFQCIMRCPKYSSSDEEPDYYETHGANIHQLGKYLHQYRLGLITEGEVTEVKKTVPKEYELDYTNRRAFNLAYNLHTLDLVKEGEIDFLIIPQDDSAKYGYTAMDQEVVREKIAKELLYDQVFMYPGADEIAMTLISRVINEFWKQTPKVYIKYASVHAEFQIPAYEDRSLGETLKYHVIASGCRLTESYEAADIILGITAPGGQMVEAASQPINRQEYQVERNLTEFMLFVGQCIKDGKRVTIGDNAFANGSDLEVIALLNKMKLLDKVAGYAGWNTSSNTIGTALSEGVLHYYYGHTKQLLNFLMERYIEDAGYCALHRGRITKEELPKYDMNYFDVKEKEGVVSKLVEERLNEFKESYLDSVAEHIKIQKVWMPWRRMFEVGLIVVYDK